MSFTDDLHALRDATLAARQRLEDDTITTRVWDGKVQVVRVVKRPSGGCDVTPVSDFLAAPEVVRYLESMQ